MAEGTQVRDLTEQGFTIEEVETSAKGETYTVPVPQADSWEVYFEFWKSEGHNPDEVLTKILNAQNEQGAKQGNKAQVREAADSDDPEALAAAIKAHQDTARGFVLGAPRGGGGARHSTGLTQKQRQDLGTKLAEVTMAKASQGKAPTQADINAIYAELGLPAPGA